MKARILAAFECPVRRSFRVSCCAALSVSTALWAAFSAPLPAAETLVEGLTLLRGATNGALVRRGDKVLAVYGDPREEPGPAEMVLFTHGRRDAAWAGRELVRRGAKAVVPAAEVPLFADVEEFWKAFATKRFHDYDQQTTKVLVEPIRPTRAVKGGETVEWEGLSFRVVDTPGYTRGAVSYVVDLGGKRIAFTGDLIHGDGKILDLYSLQDAIPEAGIGGYHGYAARLGALLTSLERILAEKPDILVPTRGPVVADPAGAVAALAERVRRFYANYLSIDALRWYFKDAHILAKARRVLGPEAKVDWMPMAETIREELPGWLIEISNTRLILASDGAGFLIDCGGDPIIREIEKLREAGRLGAIEHLFITHYHDDHTNRVAKLVAQSATWSAPAMPPTVLVSAGQRDVIENPGAYRLPCLTTDPVHVSARAASGDSWRWKEFRMTLFYFPGQTILHDALLVERDGGEKVFFIGDSFTPSGIDDYCLLNRNLLHEGKGYFFCLDLLRDRAPDALLVNQHVGPTFRFSRAQIDRMLATLRERVELLRPLVSWNDPNFALDEGWARFYPYAVRTRRGETTRVSLRIFNHAPEETIYRATLRVPEGWVVQSSRPSPIRIPARVEGSVLFELRTPADAPPGLRVITADVAWGGGAWEGGASEGGAWEGGDLREWTEALVEVEP